jgi:hypothetical protein
MVKEATAISMHYWEYQFKDSAAKITCYSATGEVNEPYPENVQDLVNHQRYDGYFIMQDVLSDYLQRAYIMGYDNGVKKNLHAPQWGKFIEDWNKENNKEIK